MLILSFSSTNNPTEASRESKQDEKKKNLSDKTQIWNGNTEQSHM